MGCMRPELREAHPAIVGWSTRNRPFFPRPINDRMASRRQIVPWSTLSHANWVPIGRADERLIFLEGMKTERRGLDGGCRFGHGRRGCVCSMLSTAGSAPTATT